MSDGLAIFRIRRFVPENISATYGIFLQDYTPFAVTIELPYKNNQNDISCFDEGEYICERYSSEKYKNVWQITNVKNRTFILIHWANYLKDIKGCVGVGEKFSDINNDGVMDIAESKNLPNEGFNELMKRTEGMDRFRLIVEKCYTWTA